MLAAVSTGGCHIFLTQISSVWEYSKQTVRISKFFMLDNFLGAVLEGSSRDGPLELPILRSLSGGFQS